MKKSILVHPFGVRQSKFTFLKQKENVFLVRSIYKSILSVSILFFLFTNSFAALDLSRVDAKHLWRSDVKLRVTFAENKNVITRHCEREKSLIRFGENIDIMYFQYRKSTTFT